MLKHVDPSQPWAPLLRTALGLIDSAETAAGVEIPWSLGGGTVLMFRFNHRRSKDIDIFLEDPQLLGFFNPRLHDHLQQFESSYDASSQSIKLRAPEGDIDFVVSGTLTQAAYRHERLLEHRVRVQTSAEIVARKLWHRGNLAVARDLLDLAVVAKADGELGRKLRPALERNGATFVAQCRERRRVLEPEFLAIDVIDFHDDYDTCLARVTALVHSLD